MSSENGVISFDNFKDGCLMEVGGKAYSLYTLRKLGYCTPNGFVITSSTFIKFLKHNKIYNNIFDLVASLKEDLENLNFVSQKIEQLISLSSFHNEILKEIENKIDDLGGKSFAVRSSSASEDGSEYSWAGQMTSIMGVGKEEIEQAIKTCWASFFSPQSLSYRSSNSLPFEIGNNAVIIQEMVNSEFSGVAFSVDPRTPGSKNIIVESINGLGEALVSGKIMPIRYIFDKETLELVDYGHITQKKIFTLDSFGKTKWIEEEQLSDTELDYEILRELLSNMKNLEKSWNCPVDVEWAVENNRLYILQCRPVTNLKKYDKILS